MYDKELEEIVEVTNQCNTSVLYKEDLDFISTYNVCAIFYIVDVFNYNNNTVLIVQSNEKKVMTFITIFGQSIKKP